jgi:hypothetical protein
MRRRDQERRSCQGDAGDRSAGRRAGDGVRAHHVADPAQPAAQRREDEDRRQRQHAEPPVVTPGGPHGASDGRALAGGR